MDTKTLRERASKWQEKHGVAFETYPGEQRAEIRAWLAGYQTHRRKSLNEAILETKRKTGKYPDFIFYSVQEFNKKIDKVPHGSVVLLYEDECSDSGQEGRSARSGGLQGAQRQSYPARPKKKKEKVTRK